MHTYRSVWKNATTIPLYTDILRTSLCYELFVFPPLVPDDYVLFTYNKILNLQNNNILKQLDEGGKGGGWREVPENALTICQSVLQSYNIESVLVRFKSNCKKTIRWTKNWKPVRKNTMKQCPLWCLNIKTGNTFRLPPFEHILRRKQHPDFEKDIQRLIFDTICIVTYIHVNDQKTL